MGYTQNAIVAECKAAPQVSAEKSDELCGYFMDFLTQLYPNRHFVTGDVAKASNGVELEILAAGTSILELRVSWQEAGSGRHGGQEKGFATSGGKMSAEMARQFVFDVMSDSALPF